MPYGKPKRESEFKDVLLRAATDGEGLDTLADVVERFIRRVGGADGLAKMLYDEYQEAKPGSLLRQRILDMALRAWGKVEGARGADDLGMLDDADLERLIQQRLKEAEKNHATAEPGPVAVAESGPETQQCWSAGSEAGPNSPVGIATPAPSVATS
jgi:hypothetical protein